MIIKQFVVTVAVGDEEADKFNDAELDRLVYEGLTDACIGAVHVRQTEEASVNVPDPNPGASADSDAWDRAGAYWEGRCEAAVETFLALQPESMVVRTRAIELPQEATS